MLFSSFKAKEVALPIDAAEYATELNEWIKKSTHKKTTVEAQPGEDFARSFGG